MRTILPVFITLGLASAAHAAPPLPTPPYGLPALSRADFNRLALSAELPLFWKVDSDMPGSIEPGELVVLGTLAPKKYIAKPKTADALPTFTKDFEKAYRALVELRRREAIGKELAAGRPTLVETDLREGSPEEQAVLVSMAKVAAQIDALHAVQSGSAVLAKQLAKLPKDDVASRAVFVRNQGPGCEGPETQSDPFCSALPSFAKPVSFSWPIGEAQDKAMCDKLAAEPNAKDLTAPFTVVRALKKGGYEAVPYTKAYGPQMKAIAATLKATAKLVKDPAEEPFKQYLLAAAKAFETNDWVAADEAWTNMSAENSKWYLRIGPDETYWDPCGVKAGFHMSFARINSGALAWKEKLTGVRSELEQTLAALIGAPYVAREVGFDLPEFIDIVINAGDSKNAFGATIGQSLPNFGKVAEESRGRTVAMANLYTDADSAADLTSRDRSLLSEATLKYASDDPAVEQLGTVLHEATHNLGPYSSYKVENRLPQEIFGGTTDAILEELKSQTGALYFLPFLKTKGLISDELVRQSYTASISWAFGHIARGMTTPDGSPKTYSQLSAIQVGWLVEAGALRWVETEVRDGDTGRFEIDYEKLPPAIEALMKEVSRIKAVGDVKAAGELIAKHTSPEGLARIHADVITARVLRYPRATFVYALRTQ